MTLEERRTDVRVPPRRPMMIEALGLGKECAVQDVSARGFSVTTSTPLTPGESYRFCIPTAFGEQLFVTAVCRHCRAQSDEATSFLAGFELLPSGVRDLRIVLGIPAGDDAFAP